MIQTAILVLSAAAIALVAEPSLARWGVLVGLASQPFWLWETGRKRQWGMLALSVWYTGSWAYGVWNYWR